MDGSCKDTLNPRAQTGFCDLNGVLMIVVTRALEQIGGVIQGDFLKRTRLGDGLSYADVFDTFAEVRDEEGIIEENVVVAGVSRITVKTAKVNHWKMAISTVYRSTGMRMKDEIEGA